MTGTESCNEGETHDEINCVLLHEDINIATMIAKNKLNVFFIIVYVTNH